MDWVGGKVDHNSGRFCGAVSDKWPGGKVVEVSICGKNRLLTFDIDRKGMTGLLELDRTGTSWVGGCVICAGMG